MIELGGEKRNKKIQSWPYFDANQKKKSGGLEIVKSENISKCSRRATGELNQINNLNN